MATYTKNIKLLKPAETEKYDVNLRNDNWDKIDKAIGDTSDLVKKHKEANPIDHPDGSVTTPKLRDKSVTLPKLADDVTALLQRTYVKKTGDTMTGNLEFNNGIGIMFNNANNTVKTKIRVAPNGNFDIGVVESNTEYGATDTLNLISINKPKWYNNKIGGKPLATEEDVNRECSKRVNKTGDSMSGDLILENNSALKLRQANTNKYHVIASDNETFELGSRTDTQKVKVNSINRPEWISGETVKQFAMLGDFSITTGTIDNDQYLPVPQGFNENECNWFISPNNLNKDNNKLSLYQLHTLTQTPVCRREGRKVIVGTYIDRHSSNTDGPRYNSFFPGTANYMCIAFKRG
ncbi:MAG: hypothetical protein E6790_08785 [Veillonella sp.]|uniref:hypothetical protein n=1 Tax=Veillonella sp. TaxID=1926307 RepID=UPI002903F760|nr:hypothetical protein [Veillonella sp.]MDU1827553.1 hypothetical protein [Veillonella sp.]